MKKDITTLVDEAVQIDEFLKAEQKKLEKKTARLTELKQMLKTYAAEKHLIRNKKGETVLRGSGQIAAIITAQTSPAEITVVALRDYLRTVGKIKLLPNFCHVLVTEVRKYLGDSVVDEIGIPGERDEYGRIAFKKVRRDVAKTVVIFRWWRVSEGVIALFPEEPGTESPFTCNSYQHTGQHGAADPTFIVWESRLATEEEYASLKQELEGLGYDLIVRKRLTQRQVQKRLDALAAKNKTLDTGSWPW